MSYLDIIEKGILKDEVWKKRGIELKKPYESFCGELIMFKNITFAGVSPTTQEGVIWAVLLPWIWLYNIFESIPQW